MVRLARVCPRLRGDDYETPVISDTAARLLDRYDTQAAHFDLAEAAARELPNLPLEDALQLVHLYAEKGDPAVSTEVVYDVELQGDATHDELQALIERVDAIAFLRNVGFTDMARTERG